MRRILCSTLMVAALTASATSAVAADEAAAVSSASLAPAMTVSAAALAETAQLALARPTLGAPAPQARRPLVLPALYVGSAALQAFDAYSTMAALQAGGREANPLMQGVVKRPLAFVATKAGLTGLSILAAEQLWKQNRKAAAIGTMIAANVVMGAVAAHNASVMSQLR